MATSKASPKASTVNGKATAAAPVSGMAALCDELASQFAERRQIIRALALAFLAGENAYLLGKPGTAKSLLVRTFAQAFGLSYGELLFTRFTTPEEVFGPLSLKALEQDRYVRATAGYMPTCEVYFADEVFKANSGILNALLTMLNEHVFHNDGKPQPAPLVSCISASNELPESESELGALYDRFLVRLVTQYVQEKDNFRSMLKADKIVVKARVDLRAEQAAVAAVTIPDNVWDAVVELRYAVKDAGFEVSDRRWRQCINLLKASAHLDGRTECTGDDLECLQDALWRLPEEKAPIGQIIAKQANPEAAMALKTLDALRELKAGLPTVPADTKERFKVVAQYAQANGEVEKMVDRIKGLKNGGKRAAEALVEAQGIQDAVIRMVKEASGLRV